MNARPHRVAGLDDGSGHQPRRPSWDCLACERPWPCDPARERLTLRFHPVILSIMQVQRLYEAAVDMPTASPAELFDQFLAWTRPPQ